MKNQTLVFGSITNLQTGEDYDWDETPLEEAIADCKKLAGTKYGKHWQYGGDCFPEEGSIELDAGDAGTSYGGKTAVADFLNATLPISRT